MNSKTVGRWKSILKYKCKTLLFYQLSKFRGEVMYGY